MLLLMIITAVDVSVGKVIDSGNTFSLDWGRTIKVTGVEDARSPWPHKSLSSPSCFGSCVVLIIRSEAFSLIVNLSSVLVSYENAIYARCRFDLFSDSGDHSFFP